MKVSELRLPLKRQWFEMTASGFKPEDYREVNEYWYVRLVNRANMSSINKAQLAFWVEQLKDQEGLNTDILNNVNNIFKGCFKSFTTNVMTLGYPKANDTTRIQKNEHAGIEIRTGNPEWGAEPGKIYFVIKHGKRLS